MKSGFFRIIIIAALLSLACTTKVSEWVLINSPAERYLLVYYHSGAISEAEKRQNNQLESTFKSANLAFRTVEKENIQKPYYALYYRNRLFSEYSSYQDVQNITTSPLREKIAGELMAGQLCVMLYLKSGNTAKDEKGLQALQKSVASSPFREIISVVELERNSEPEKHLVSMLLNVEDDLKSIQEPMLFGVFGRFRALEPLLGKGISEENIKLMIDFFTADCSCVIKDDLPGISILYRSTWENPRPARVNKILDENPALLHH